MKPAAFPLATVHARLIAPGALQALQRTATWSVLQVHPDACNLGAEPDQLVALVSQAAGAGPFSIVVGLLEHRGGFTEFADPGDRAEVRAGVLVLGNLQIELETAQVWRPQPAWEALRAAGSLARWLGPLAESLQAQAPPGSLADGLAEMLDGGSAEDTAPGDPKREPPRAARVELGREGQRAAPGDLGQQVLRTAVAAGRDLIESLARADLQAASEAAGRLAGLGIGLTPAGDDFLVGAMLALWSGADSEWARRAGQAVIEEAAHKTNRISRAWLRAAAQGEASEAWHALVRSMIDDEAPAVRRALERIVRQGHTSGADALTGYVSAASKTAPGSGAV